uniref:ATP synthase CF0 B chain subunit I n=1 Tax=Lotharella vacuolata TaxID=74820 RepID=A0A140JZR7_9EUKA|nr:ATP synthase CF0 B chain subunit I [Lotharella vacuolata]BAU62594.1 ATP synthase CF0 B chain subunit I [Lotharella vacuolata]
MNDILFYDGFQDLFELNLDLFDTNIINLSIVLFVVIKFLGNFISTTLELRRKLIIDNLQNSNKKILLVKEELKKANKKLEDTKQSLIETYDFRFQTFQKRKLLFLEQVENYLIQSDFIKQNILTSQTKKVLANIYNKLVISIFNKLYNNITLSFCNSSNFSKKRKLLTNHYLKRLSGRN